MFYTKIDRREAGKSSGSVLDCQSLGPWLKEAGGRLVSLVVACWTANHQVLGSKKKEGGW